jgi:hypothetical protein
MSGFFGRPGDALARLAAASPGSNLVAGAAAAILALSAAASAQIPKYDHVVIVVMENHALNQVYGSASAPYLTQTAGGDQAALFTQSYALTHPSQPNYLQMFSGSIQGVTDDKVPANLPFTTANLGAELIAAGRTFRAYSEDLPSVGFTGATSAKYARKHCPWVNWQGTGKNGIPAADHLPFTDFPKDYSYLPTVTYVIPNLISDIHDGTVSQGDTWVKKNLDGYVQWAKTHNSLFILTFDEDDKNNNNRILTFFVGAKVKKGTYDTHIDHYSVLRTLEDMYGLTHAGAAAQAKPIVNVWEPPTAARPAPLRNAPVTSGARCRADGALLGLPWGAASQAVGAWFALPSGSK